MKGLAVLLVVTLLWHGASAQTNCHGQVNNEGIWTGTPKFVRRVPNAELYMAGEGYDQINLIHLYGTPYEMGHGYGQLMKDDIMALFVKTEQWIETQAEEILKSVPKEIADVIAKYGVGAALDLTYFLLESHTPQHFKDEMNGMADALGVSYMTVVRPNMIPELVKAACSMYGAHGNATLHSTNGTLVQLRALDWNTNGPFQDYPAVTVYHPSSPQYGHPFANVAWTGFIGALTGFSSAPIGICEKVWLSYKGKDSRIGYPWMFLLRDILQFDSNAQAGLDRMINADRTCSIFSGIGDGNENLFYGIEYAHESLNVFTATNYDNYTPGHPLIPHIMYWDKHMQPSHDPCLPSLLQKYYGRLDAETTHKYITSQFETGDLHLAVYEFNTQSIYVANAAKTGAPGNPNAYARQFVKFALKTEFARPYGQ